jgi:signal transduction histidine kinase/ActR/RegA family two-component response regulator
MLNATPSDDTRILYTRVATLCGIAAIIGGLAVLGGWLFDLPRLTDFTFDGITMKANAALSLSLSGAALLLLLPAACPRWRLNAGRSLAVAVSLAGFLTFSEHLVGWDLGIDELLAREAPGAVATARPGRMGPPASTCYTLIGISLLVMRRQSRRSLVFAQGIPVFVIFLSLLNLTGNIYGATQLYATALYTGISRQTSLLLIVLAIGMLCARPDRGLMAVFTSVEPGGVTLRRLIVPSVTVPIIFGWFCIYGIIAKWLDVRFGVALFTVSVASAIVIIIWWNSNAINALSARRRQAEMERERLLESERHARMEVERAGRLKDEFLANLSHELRTPLNAIIGWVHLLRTNSADPVMLKKGIDVIGRNARVQSELIADLLDMSRIISGKMRLEVQPVDLHAVIHAAVEAVRLAADQKGVHIQLLLDPLGDLVPGDPARLQQVIWNLVSNAVKFTAPGGSVIVTLAKTEASVDIKVTDTGQGIAAEFLPHVFDRFRQADASITRKKGGLGLGLAIVKELVELHGGQVALHSEGVGKGVVAKVTLPITLQNETREHRRQSVSPQLPDPQQHGSLLAGARILIVEDESDTRELIHRIVSECGAETSAVATAEDALRLLRSSRFDLLISDIGMPETSGYQLIQTIRAEGIDLPALALTAYARAEDRDHALHAGFQVHVAKPFQPNELLSEIVNLLAHSRSRKMLQ